MNLTPQSYDHCHPRLRLKEMAGRDKTSGEGNHRRGSGSTQYRVYCPRTMFIQKSLSITGERSVPLLLRLVTHCTLADSPGGLTKRGC